MSTRNAPILSTTSLIHLRDRAACPGSAPRLAKRRRPVAPTRRHADVDTLVGVACVAILPLALWLI